MSDRLLSTTPMRLPRAILGFGLFYVAFAIAAFANNLAMIDGIQGQLTAALGAQAPGWLGYFGFAVRLLIRLLLAYLVVFRANGLARWGVLLFALPWVWQVRYGLPALLGGALEWLPWLAIVSLHIVALGFLVTPGARRWIALKGRTTEIDVQDFS